jgi:hypothetical protein
MNSSSEGGLSHINLGGVKIRDIKMDLALLWFLEQVICIYSEGQNCFNVLNVCNKTRITWEPSKLES